MSVVVQCRICVEMRVQSGLAQQSQDGLWDEAVWGNCVCSTGCQLLPEMLGQFIGWKERFRKEVIFSLFCHVGLALLRKEKWELQPQAMKERRLGRRGKSQAFRLSSLRQWQVAAATERILMI